MKNFLKDCLMFLLLTLICGVSYLLPMLLFVWMHTWPHWAIVIVLVFMCGVLMQILGWLSGSIGGLPFRTIAGIVLACLEVLHILGFSIWAIWTSLPYTNGWEIAIDVFATICYAVMYIAAIVMLIAKYIEYRNGEQ